MYADGSHFTREICKKKFLYKTKFESWGGNILNIHLLLKMQDRLCVLYFCKCLSKYISVVGFFSCHQTVNVLLKFLNKEFKCFKVCDISNE